MGNFMYDAFSGELDFNNYEYIKQYANIVRPAQRPVLGRDQEIRKVKASLERVEVSNVILLGPAGSGKTMLVQGVAKSDPDRIYLEVDLARMSESVNGEDGALQMASRLKGFFDDIQKYRKDMLKSQSAEASDDTKITKSKEIVVFIDEFHQIIELSSAATEAIKPVLADSGSRGIKIIAATTVDEFIRVVSPNQALVERLQRINLGELPQSIVVDILKSMAKTNGVESEIFDLTLYDMIYDITNRYVPASSQPRKSVLVFDAMLGWYNAFGSKLNKQLLADVIYDSVGVNVNFNVDGRKIRETLNNRVFNQEFATRMIETRLQTDVADLHDASRPMSSFLFTGPTGTGKTEMAKGLAELLFGTERAMIRFDMSEYKEAGSSLRFREALTAQTWAKPNSIILLDEIEKAAPSVTRLLLQVLDDARLNDSNNREVSFHNAYIIITTNVGSDVYERLAHYTTEADAAGGLSSYTKVIRKALMADEAFPAELLNRLDVLIPFAPIQEGTMKRIVERSLGHLIDAVMRKHDVVVKIHKDVVDYLVYEDLDKDTDSGGARGIMRKMDLEVTSAISRYINIHDVSTIGVKIKGEMSYRNKTQRESRASVEVVTIDASRHRRG